MGPHHWGFFICDENVPNSDFVVITQYCFPKTIIKWMHFILCKYISLKLKIMIIIKPPSFLLLCKISDLAFFLCLISRYEPFSPLNLGNCSCFHCSKEQQLSYFMQFFPKSQIISEGLLKQFLIFICYKNKGKFIKAFVIFIHVHLQ